MTGLSPILKEPDFFIYTMNSFTLLPLPPIPYNKYLLLGVGMQRQSPCNVTICCNNMNMQFMNISISSSSSSMQTDLHHIVPFVVSIVLTLVQIRYPSENLFDKHQKTMVVVMSSLLLYCLAFGVLSRSDTTFGDRFGTTEYNWCCISMVVFGSVSVAALLPLLFPHSDSKPLLYLLWVGQLLLVLGLLRKLVLQLVTKTLFPPRRTISRLLPVTSSDVSPPVLNIGYRYWNNQPPPIFNIGSRYWNDRWFFGM